MVQPIVHDALFLAQPSAPATIADLPAVQDLLDTLAAHSEGCVGLAGNMIGVRKCIIAVSLGPVNLAMLNPAILQRSRPYEAEEGCLSLSGTRKAKRWQTITVQYQDTAFASHTQTFEGFTAQIIQHEIDHCNGVLI